MVGKTDDRGSTVDINERFLEAVELEPGAARARWWDSRLPGFGVTIGKRRVSFVVQRRIKGERTQSSVTIGHWAPGKLRAADSGLRDRTLTVKIARDMASDALSNMRGGHDPRGDVPTGANGPTLRQGLALHVSNMRKRSRSPRSIETIETEVPRLLEAWLDRPIGELNGAHLVEIHDQLTSEGKAYLANRLVAHASAIWNALDRVHELDGRNPARAVTRNKYTPKRERIPDEELPAWWTKVQSLSPVRRDLQLFCLATGMRSEAARHMRWEHLDDARSALLVPSPKGGATKAFTLPIAPRTLAMLRNRRASNATEFAPFHGDHGWVFPSLSRAAPFSVQPLAEPKEYRQSRTETGRKEKIMPGLHTLRRTYLSIATEAGIGELDRHVLANHAFGRQSVNESYIAQSFTHLAECQARIERAIWARLAPGLVVAR